METPTGELFLREVLWCCIGMHHPTRRRFSHGVMEQLAAAERFEAFVVRGWLFAPPPINGAVLPIANGKENTLASDHGCRVSVGVPKRRCNTSFYVCADVCAKCVGKCVRECVCILN